MNSKSQLLYKVVGKKFLYLETSIFGFYYNEELINLEKKEQVRKLLGQIREGIFDGIVSLNLRHIGNTWRIKKFNGVNLMMGYKLLEIVTPGEVIFYED